MTKTLELPKNKIVQAMRIARTESPEEAVIKALDEYAQRHDQASLVQHLGKFKDIMTLEELEKMRGAE